MHSFKKPDLPLILVTAFAWLSAAPLYAQGPLGESANDPLLDTINNEFRVQYQEALAAALAQAGPVILEEGDDLILIHKGERAGVLVKLKRRLRLMRLNPPTKSKSVQGSGTRVNCKSSRAKPSPRIRKKKISFSFLLRPA